jgi:hypothetical protein
MLKITVISREAAKACFDHLDADARIQSAVRRAVDETLAQMEREVATRSSSPGSPNSAVRRNWPTSFPD